MVTSDWKLLDSYLQHCGYERHLGALSLKAYGIDLRQFLLFISGRSDFHQVDKETLKAYLKHLFGVPLRESSVKRKITCLKGFFAFLEAEQVIEESPFHKMKFSIKIPRRLPEVMNIRDVTELITLAKQNLEKRKSTTREKIDLSSCVEHGDLVAFQDLIIIELLFATGMRVKELSSLNVGDIDLVRRLNDIGSCTG